MLYLLLEIADEKKTLFAISALNIIEVIPFVPLIHFESIRAPCIGLLQYQKKFLPVVSLGAIFNPEHTPKKTLSSRIVLLKSQKIKNYILALQADSILNTTDAEIIQQTPPPYLNISDYFKDYLSINGDLIPILSIESFAQFITEELPCT